MSEQVITPGTISELPPRITETRRFFKVFLSRGLVVFGMVIVLFFVLIAAFGPLLAPYEPNVQVPRDRLQNPSWEHWLGTDNFGRDTLSRLIIGSRNSLMVGVVGVGIAAGIWSATHK